MLPRLKFKRRKGKEMNIRLNALWLSASLALGVFITKPVMADDWNKRIEFQFSAPVEIPGKVLTPGKYVFQLADSQSDRSIVEVFSQDSNGKESLVTTIFAVPDYIENVPDKPVIHFEERRSGTPEAIHSWFYPGEHTGWEFVYPKANGLEASADAAPAPTPAAVAAAPAPVTPAAEPAPVATAAAPSEPPALQSHKEVPGPQVAAVREEILVAQNNTSPQSAVNTDSQNNTGQTLPQTGGYSDLALMTGLAMLGGGIAAVFASRHKSPSLN
jgi:hypothetical protein